MGNELLKLVIRIKQQQMKCFLNELFYELDQLEWPWTQFHFNPKKLNKFWCQIKEITQMVYIEI